MQCFRRDRVARRIGVVRVDVRSFDRLAVCVVRRVAFVQCFRRDRVARRIGVERNGNLHCIGEQCVFGKVRAVFDDRVRAAVNFVVRFGRFGGVQVEKRRAQLVGGQRVGFSARDADVKRLLRRRKRSWNRRRSVLVEVEVQQCVALAPKYGAARFDACPAFVERDCERDRFHGAFRQLGHFGQERRSSAHGDFDDELHANVLLCVSLEEQFQYSTPSEEFRPLFVPFLSRRGKEKALAIASAFFWCG